MHLQILSYCGTPNYLYIIVTYHSPVHVCKYLGQIKQTAFLRNYGVDLI